MIYSIDIYVLIALFRYLLSICAPGDFNQNEWVAPSNRPMDSMVPSASAWDPPSDLRLASGRIRMSLRLEWIAILLILIETLLFLGKGMGWT